MGEALYRFAQLMAGSALEHPRVVTTGAGVERRLGRLLRLVSRMAVEAVDLGMIGTFGQVVGIDHGTG